VGRKWVFFIEIALVVGGEYQEEKYKEKNTKGREHERASLTLEKQKNLSI